MFWVENVFWGVKNVFLGQKLDFSGQKRVFNGPKRVSRQNPDFPVKKHPPKPVPPLAKSQAKRLEENDEIKHLNELILEAKCHAIRDAQVQEL